MSDGFERRLAQLAAEHGLTPRGVHQVRQVLDLVAADETAPTTVRDRRAGLDAHVADSLTGLAVPALRDAALVADLGAGAGFPGIVLAAARPAARVVLVESLARKCAFLERAIAAADLPNAEVVCARAEEWEPEAPGCDAVTARAVAALAVLVEYAAPLLRLGGTLVAWKGTRDREEEAGGRAAAEIVGLEPQDPLRVRGVPGADQRHLHVFTKVAETPDRFPRRPGMARKRPLGTGR